MNGKLNLPFPFPNQSPSLSTPELEPRVNIPPSPFTLSSPCPVLPSNHPRSSLIHPSQTLLSLTLSKSLSPLSEFCGLETRDVEDVFFRREVVAPSASIFAVGKSSAVMSYQDWVSLSGDILMGVWAVCPGE